MNFSTHQCQKGAKETQFTLVDKLRFFDGGELGRDALRKQHSALFLAKARAEAMLQAFEPLGSNPVIKRKASSWDLLSFLAKDAVLINYLLRSKLRAAA